MTSLQYAIMWTIPIVVGFYVGFRPNKSAAKETLFLAVGVVVYSGIWLLIVGDFSAGFTIGALVGGLFGLIFLLVQNVVHGAVGLVVGIVARRLRARASQGHKESSS